MIKIMQTIQNMLADAALLEMGVDAVSAPRNLTRAFRRSLEEHFVEIAFAEAADYDQIHKAILWEHRTEMDIALPDECQYGDNDLCCTH